MDYLKILHENPDLADEFDSLFDFFLLDELSPRDDAEGRCTFSMPGMAFARDGSGGEYHLLEDGSIGYYSSEGEAGRLAESMDDLFSLLVSCICWHDCCDAKQYVDSKTLEEYGQRQRNCNLENMDLDSVFKEAEAENHMVHGDYNYHNLLVCQEGMAVTGFEHAHRDVQMEDLYYFLRKCMEKHHYDERLGYRMMRAYDSVNNLGKKERDYLAIRLAYPEKFWKITNSYYHSGKAWIPAKNVEKLSLSVAQTEEKKRFLRNLFAFQI